MNDIPNMLIQIVIRPFKYVFYIFEDIKIFWKIVYSENVNENKEDQKSLINKDIILALRKVVFDFRYQQKKKIISMDEIYNRLGLSRKSKKALSVIRDKINSSFVGSE